MSDINIERLGVAFPDGTVGLEDINLHIDSGEFVALVGPSGSGKTTLLRTLAGFVKPSQGTIALGGEDVSNTPPEKRRMGMVFQQHAVWPHMDVAANVAYPLQRAGVRKKGQRERVDETLSTVGLAGYGSRKPSTLSGGQRQRVALARAIVARPQVLLLDEALSALDEPLRDSLRRELVTLTKQSSLTTVHVTHDRKEAIAIADRIALLRDGKLEQFDTPREIVTKPATPWVASFIADATLLEGRIENGRVITTAPEFSWDVGEVTMIGEEGRGDVSIAVLPEAVEVVESASAPRGEISSVLFEISGYSVTVNVGGVEFRAQMPASSDPRIGQQVDIAVRSPLAYPGR